MLSGHIGSPRDGILMVKPKNNSQGLIDMGIVEGREALEGVKALIVFGENADIDTDELEFLAVCDTHMTELAAKADVVLPGTGFASVDGTYTNTERRLQLVEAAIEEGILFSNWEIAVEIAHIFEVDLDWDGTDDISDEIHLNAFNYGDANNDGKINGKDVLVMRKYIVGLDVEINLYAADVLMVEKINVNGKDVLQLRKYLIGLEKEIGIYM